MPSDQPGRLLVQDGNWRRAQLIHSLAKRFFRRQLPQSQSPAKELFLPKGFDVGIVALAEAQQSDHCRQHVAVRHFRPFPLSKADFVEPLSKRRLLQNSTGQCQTRVRNEDFVRMRNDKFHELCFLTFRVNRCCSPSSTKSSGKQAQYAITLKTSSRNQGMRLKMINLGSSVSDKL